MSKIERGHVQDLKDAEAFVSHGLVDPQLLRRFFDAIEPALIRFPSIDPPTFRAKLQAFLDGH
jgi:hypothetical protein